MFIKNLKAHMIESAWNTEASMIPFGLFGLISLPLFYYINLYISTPQTHMSYPNIILRIVCALLCFVLTLKNYWPHIFRPYLPIVWYSAILLFMPFFATFMALENHLSAAWLLNTLAIFILLMFLLDWIAYTVLLVSGIILGVSLYYWVTPQAALHFTIDTQPLTLIDIILTYCVSLIMGVIFCRNKELMEHGKLQAMKAIGASVAHELRTPLASIYAGLEGVKRYLPKLLEGYELAKQQALSVPYIRPDHFKLLTEVLDEMGAEIHSAHTIIDMLLLRVTSSVQKTELAPYGIKECVEEAIQRYPFNSNDQRNWVHCIVTEDFIFQGEKLFLIHVIFNLLKNALYYIAHAEKGEIFIWSECNSKENRLYFKDTAQGMNPHVHANIFKKFFTYTHNGTGLGLSFCKMVMEKSGGDIICNTKEGEYSEFILSFPKT